MGPNGGTIFMTTQGARRRARAKAQRGNRGSGHGRMREMALVAGVAVIAVVALILGGEVLRIRQSGSGPAIDPNIVRERNVLGSGNAPLTLVEYSDFQCPHCGQFARGTEKTLIEEYVSTGKLRLDLRHFAFLGPESQAAAEAVECAGDQGKFWDYHDTLFKNQSGENAGAFSKSKLTKFATDLGLDVGAWSSCVDAGTYKDKIRKDLEEGRTLGFKGTPSFVLVGTGQPLALGQRIEGPLPVSQFRQVIDQMLAQVGR